MSCRDQFMAVKEAATQLPLADQNTIVALLKDLADETERQTAFLLEANSKDLDRMDPSNPKYDRLQLSEERIACIATDIRNVAQLPSPLGRILEERTLHNSLEIKKVAVPLGVVGIIYEARPNVTFDVFSLCLRSGNACVLKGGSDAADSNKAIVRVIQQVLKRHGFSEELIQLLPPNREAAQELMQAVGFVDVLIPRGSQQLINSVRENSKVPVIETGAGIVHTYFDTSGDLKKGQQIIHNAKTRRVSVCNALDCLIIHQDRLNDLPVLVEKLKEENVTIYADPRALVSLQGHYPGEWLQPASEESFGTEFLSLKMAIKTVNNFQQALQHIAQYSSRHSEAIIAEDETIINTFLLAVDAAAVYANTSTAFTDGAQFGLGAEIGISTQKLHARGPMALAELTSYKWVIRGDGQIRPR